MWPRSGNKTFLETANLSFSSSVHRERVSQQSGGAGRGRAEQTVARDDFTAPDKVKAPRVCMCRIDYQARGTTAQSTGLTDSQDCEPHK